MSKSISLKTKDGTEYTLEYTRKTAELAESQGLNIQELADKPVTNVPILVRCAFLKNHKGISKDKIDEIYESIQKKKDFLECLVAVYAESLESILLDKEDDSGNAEWEMKG